MSILYIYKRLLIKMFIWRLQRCAVLPRLLKRGMGEGFDSRVRQSCRVDI